MTRSIGQYWGAFGGMGKISQNSINQFRTDIQLKLLDVGTNERTFVSTSLPFGLTLSIDPGDPLTVYFVKGGLQQPSVPGDFRLDGWYPFVGHNSQTGQLVPLGPLPTLEPPTFQLGGVCAVFFGIALVLLLIAAAASSGGTLIAALFFAGIGGAVLWFGRQPKKTWEVRYAAAQQFAAQTTI